MLVFQYGSNMSSKRLNAPERLAGDAKRIGIAQTSISYRLCFPVWSNTNSCAAASISPDPNGRPIFGVLYEIPSSLVYRQEAKTIERKSLDAIEGEGKNYIRSEIDVIQSDGTEISAITYLAKSVGPDLKTSSNYASHILTGLAENDMPQVYRAYVASRITQSNPELVGMVED
ncbi:gamma-glutamylcyclotransferase family protein [Halomonas elongata]|uniref:gamma-glutamylcyclotransferase family protein n=1 Tax=Halomonas elongata TaxID=2746 RepID=UPI00255ACBE2|nr:gamma-glutamylcyclotransferase family protein [Halomonas elongata]MDL4862571.1 gamma-glutamylcyclotransferase family protein [Halomonas elongata]